MFLLLPNAIVPVIYIESCHRQQNQSLLHQNGQRLNHDKVHSANCNYNHTDQQLWQVSRLLHRLVVSNSRQPGKSDGNSAGRVDVRPAELGTRYFPDLGFLKKQHV